MIMTGISACNPQSENFLSVSSLKNIATSYNLESECLDVECALASKMELSTIGEVIQVLLKISSAVLVLLKVFS